MERSRPRIDDENVEREGTGRGAASLTGGSSTGFGGSGAAAGGGATAVGGSDSGARGGATACDGRGSTVGGGVMTGFGGSGCETGGAAAGVSSFASFTAGSFRRSETNSSFFLRQKSPMKPSIIATDYTDSNSAHLCDLRAV